MINMGHEKPAGKGNFLILVKVTKIYEEVWWIINDSLIVSKNRLW
jgi:hypothetical protein